MKQGVRYKSHQKKNWHVSYANFPVSQNLKILINNPKIISKRSQQSNMFLMLGNREY